MTVKYRSINTFAYAMVSNERLDGKNFSLSHYSIIDGRKPAKTFSRRSILLSHPRGKYVELLPVLGHSASRDIQTIGL